MPNFDGGHYFLTAIIPVNTRPCKRADGTVTTPVNALREALNSLPTAHQSKASIDSGCNSPFSRNLRTHLTRFAVINDVAYNGRDPENSIEMAIMGVNPVLPKPVDALTCPFLLWAADVDMADGSDASLDGWLAELWTQARPELTDVLQYCTGFDTVDGPEAFAVWIRRCQIETVMPFNDYWITPPPFPSLSLGRAGLGGGAGDGGGAGGLPDPQRHLAALEPLAGRPRRPAARPGRGGLVGAAQRAKGRPPGPSRPRPTAT